MRPQKKDIKMLKRHFVNNEFETALYRASSAAIVAHAKMFQEKDCTAAAKYIRRGLEFIATSPPEHDNRNLYFPPFSRSHDGFETVKPHLEEIKSVLDSNLAILEGRRARFTHLFGQNSCGGTNYHYAVHNVGVSGSEEDLTKRALAGGTYCDCCKKAVDELHVDELMKCGRCKISFYCSTACQRKAWKGGHKQDCRKKGQIEVGDDMMLNHLSSHTYLNGRFVKVVGAGATDGKWLVKLGDATEPVSVSAEKLVRLRPKEVDYE